MRFIGQGAVFYVVYDTHIFVYQLYNGFYYSIS